MNQRYSVEQVLGHGGMSTVYLALDRKLGSRVAVKRLDVRRMAPDEASQVAAQFEREARLLASLDHHGLVHVLDYFVEEGLPHLVTAFIEGRDLQCLIDTAVHEPDVETILGWADQICEVLEYLHAHEPTILFRDLKPANVMLGTDQRVRLIDFGIARLFCPRKETTVLLRGFGTPGYAPLEQYGGGTDPRSDIYALGATLYALLTRKAPPDAVSRAAGGARVEPPSALNPAVWPAIDQVVHRMMAISKDERYSSVGEARRALHQTRPSLFGPGTPVVRFCPHRDLPTAVPARSSTRSDPLRFRYPYTVICRGDYARVERAMKGCGMPGLAFYQNEFNGILPGYWMALVIH
ncbi:MAG: serine/threonine protein kinase [Armatimonadetes bacterium]|nr:serine/threonine protein kinase [Armatimonadota bacterium]